MKLTLIRSASCPINLTITIFADCAEPYRTKSKVTRGIKSIIARGSTSNFRLFDIEIRNRPTEHTQKNKVIKLRVMKT